MKTKSNGYFTWRLRVMGTLHDDLDQWVLYMTTTSNGYFTWRLVIMGTLLDDKE
jgi:hypothetical protein